MKNEEIISTLKKTYNIDLRKQVVRSILNIEEDGDAEEIELACKTINQIFSYVIGELGWRISENTNSWDDTPLDIMKEAFPKLETTKWYKDHQLEITNT